MAGARFRSSATATTTGASINVAKPAGLAVGDLMIAQMVADDLTPIPTITPPAGWTTKDSQAVTTILLGVLYQKVADAADVAASTFTFSTTGQGLVGGIIAISNPDPVTLIDQVNGSNGTSGTVITTSGITPTRADDIMLIFGYYGNSSPSRTFSGYSIATTNPTWTEIYDVSVASNVSIGIAAAYGYRGSLAATGTASVTLSGAATSGYIIQVADVSSPQIGTIASVSTMIPPIIAQVIDITIAAVATMIPPIVSEIASKWNNTSKNVSSWLNQDKTP